jgi:hypothetical protein
MDWIDLAQDRDQWRALLNTLMNFQVPWNAGNFLSGCTTCSFSRRAQLHEWVRVMCSFINSNSQVSYTFLLLIIRSFRLSQYIRFPPTPDNRDGLYFNIGCQRKNSGLPAINIYSLLWHRNFLLTKRIRLPLSAIQREHHWRPYTRRNEIPLQPTPERAHPQAPQRQPL